MSDKRSLSTKLAASIGISSNVNNTQLHDEDGKSANTNDAFHVDTGLIPQTALDDQGSSELQELGLSVFNQDAFEQGVMEQVDQALAKEEKVRLKNILHRELTAINDDIVLAKKDLDRVNRAEVDVESLNDHSRDIQRQLESIKKQKENKLKQLKTLKVRREKVRKKLTHFEQETPGTDEVEGYLKVEDSDSTFDQAFQIGVNLQKETEKERMIRTGEMTPFGTVVKTSATKPGKSSAASKPFQLSDYEKTLLSKNSHAQKTKRDFRKYLSKKLIEASQPKKDSEDPEVKSNAEGESGYATEIKINRFDEKDWRVYDNSTDYTLPRLRQRTSYQISHEFSGDSQISDDEHFCRDEEDVLDNDEDEYKPSKEEELGGESSEADEYSDNSHEDENTEGLGKCKRKGKRNITPHHRKKPRPLPKYRENDDENTSAGTRIKRDLSIRREKDDADPEFYQARLLKQQKKEQQEEKAKAMAGAENSESDGSDADLEGGLCVPQKLWKQLFKYVITTLIKIFQCLLALG